MHIDFGESKQDIIDRLGGLKSILEHSGRELELDFSTLVDKLAEGVGQVRAEKFQIAMFGAYSDGKSSLLSALTGRTDIKIAPSPTTDGIFVYDELEDYLVVDTPGLFSGVSEHEEKTRAYISEAHMVVYVVEATNPLKESHREAVHWLLDELRKLPDTLFVINKMDDVADLDDEDDFQQCAERKINALHSTLQRYAMVAERPRIVCVAAAPDGKPFEAWQGQLEEYKELSHIETARYVLGEFVRKAGDEVRERVGASVVFDVAERAIQHYAATQSAFADQLDITNNLLREQEKELEALSHTLNSAHRNIRNDILAYRDDLLSKISATKDGRQLESTMRQEIGEEGYVIEEQIDATVAKHWNQALRYERKTIEAFEKSNSFASAEMKAAAKRASEGASKVGQKVAGMSTRKVGDFVLKARDKLAGLLGKKIKFKPYGALKWAKWLQKFAKLLTWLPVLTSAFEAYSNERNARKFKDARDEAEEQVDGLFQDFLADFTFDAFVSEGNTSLPVLEQAVEASRAERDELRGLLEGVMNAQNEVIALVETLGISSQQLATGDQVGSQGA